MELVILDGEHLPEFKREMQKAFRVGAEEGMGCSDIEVLPEEDIDRSLGSVGSVAYVAMDGDEMVGGAVVVIDESRGHNHLDFLFVKVGCQNRGIGGFIWNGIESRHPDTVVWETVTPYFDIRNIHLYINKCGFHAVEFFIEKESEGDIDRLMGTDRMFRFEKKMR